MKIKNLSAYEIINRIFKVGYKSIWKSKRFIGFIASTILVRTSGITTACILTRNVEEKMYYKFDDQYFLSIENALAYARSNAEAISFGFNANNYVFNGEVFNTREQLNCYIKNKFPIATVNTIRNPGNYTINGSGELSRNVLSESYEKPITVYQGNNRSAYLNRIDALKIFTNYQKVYNIQGQIRYNEYEAGELYENSIKKKLEDSSSLQTECYLQGTVCQTKKEIKNWLRNGVKNGFECQGQYFSDYNYSEFKNIMANIDDYSKY